MKAKLLIYAVITITILGVAASGTKGQEMGRVRERIRQITPVSDMIPVAITTIRLDDADNSELETITKGMLQRFRYDLEFNPRSLLARPFNGYEKWFLAIGLNDSDPKEQRYGMWLDYMPTSGFNEEDYVLYIFSPDEQYLLINKGSVKNILTPIDKIAVLEEGLNVGRHPVTSGIPIFGGDSRWAHPGQEILRNEVKGDARGVRLVSFFKKKDGEFCIEVESPKSKSIFTFVTDRKITLEILESYNRSNNTDFKEPPPEGRYWKMTGYTSPPGVTIEKPFRTWRLLSIEDEVVTEYRAKFVSRDGKNVVLEKEDGQTITVDWSKMFESDRQIINMYLEAEKSPETETSNTP